VVRIAHRHSGRLVIPERVIFDHELVLIVHGRGHWVIEGEKRAFAAHDVLLVPPFVPHSFLGTDEQIEHVAIHFDFCEGMPPVDEALDRRVPYRVGFIQGLEIGRQRRLFAGHRVERAISRMVATHESNDVLASANASVQLAEVLLALLGEETPCRAVADGATRRQQARVELTVAHMTEHLAAGIDHAVLERVSGLSKSRLQTVFREVTGYSPLDYLRRLRVEEARRLLADQRLSVKEIAAQIGFRDTSHLSKVFRRIDGLAPAHYREALLAGRQD